MKTIGLIGGVTWESTKEYYRIINQLTRDKLGGVHSSQIILHSLDFDFILSSDWQAKQEFLTEKALLLQNAGADCLLICANTLHKLFNDIQTAVDIPLVHIADAAGAAIRERGFSKVGLLGTRPTMEMDFYKERLRKNFGIETVVPHKESRIFIQRVIYKELAKGMFLEDSKYKYLAICDELIKAGAEGIILGCTEIPLIIKQSDLKVPVFDTSYLHAAAAVEFALS